MFGGHMPSSVAEENEAHEKDDTSYSLFGFLKTLLIISAIVSTFLLCICLDVCRKNWKNGSRIDQPNEQTPLKTKQRGSSKQSRAYSNGSSPRSKRPSLKRVSQVDGGKSCQNNTLPFGPSNLDPNKSNQKQIISILKKHKYVHFHKDTKPVEITCESMHRKLPPKRSNSFPGEFTCAFANDHKHFITTTKYAENISAEKYLRDFHKMENSKTKFPKTPQPMMGLLKHKKFIRETNFLIDISESVDQLDRPCTSSSIASSINVPLSSSSSASSLDTSTSPSFTSSGEEH